MNVAIVGSNSFIGKNFYFQFKYLENINKIYLIDKKTPKKKLKDFINDSDQIFIFAGVNRPKFENEYKKNFQIVKNITSFLNKKKKIFYTSSLQSNQSNPYGISKKKSEDFLIKLYRKKKIDLKIYRLPNIFGKLSKPNYNSVVATFCYNIINNRPLKIIDNKKISLLYIDDLIKLILSDFKKKNDKLIIHHNFKNIFKIKVLNLKKIIQNIHSNYKSKSILNYNSRLKKYLYSTYLSFLKPQDFKYKIQNLNVNKTGSFIELYKSKYSGQISLLNIYGKNIRGKHFHNTKYEKFLVIHGKVRYSSVNMITKKKFTTVLKDYKLEIVNTIPGHIHLLQNLSSKPSKVLVWTNEVFDKNKPDTFQ
jgi:UDP-2-acetamido-2,6-beta-L-arabino-hexul-4-ose reductase